MRIKDFFLTHEFKGGYTIPLERETNPEFCLNCNFKTPPLLLDFYRYIMFCHICYNSFKVIPPSKTERS